MYKPHYKLKADCWEAIDKEYTVYYWRRTGIWCGNYIPIDNRMFHGADIGDCPPDYVFPTLRTPVLKQLNDD